MNLKKLFVALILFMPFMVPISAESYGNTWWYHVAGGNSVQKFESGADSYSKYDRGHYILFGAADSFSKIKWIVEACGGDIDWGDLCDYLGDMYDVTTRTASSYEAMKAYAANKGDYWYAIIWIPD